ncbi:hypothetical protein GS634_21925 [Ruegeria atlantica]|uniref:DUF3618 domain-containing protein n=1 Tax=Ruegeria atlantica TaxID=81569 RepID=A0AA90YWX5_9RHOB|nr:hypothetical protein [Ruegeria atlantica]NOE20798.1 hypothetical protein [Ruegeria atlantica]
MAHHPSSPSSAKRHAKDLAQKAKTVVASEATARAQDLQDTAADEAKNVAQAAESAAEAFEAGSAQHQVMSKIADSMENVAAQVRNTDLRTVNRKVSDFARQNPLLFIGSAALVGFAATRFLGARNTHQTTSAEFEADPWATQQQPQRNTLDDTPGHTTVLAKVNEGYNA